MAVDEAEVGGVEAEPDADPALVAQLAHDAGAHGVHGQVGHLVHELHPVVVNPPVLGLFGIIIPSSWQKYCMLFGIM